MVLVLVLAKSTIVVVVIVMTAVVAVVAVLLLLHHHLLLLLILPHFHHLLLHHHHHLLLLVVTVSIASDGSYVLTGGSRGPGRKAWRASTSSGKSGALGATTNTRRMMQDFYHNSRASFIMDIALTAILALCLCVCRKYVDSS